jgi:two-component system sensor histidine kinase HydH
MLPRGRFVSGPNPDYNSPVKRGSLARYFFASTVLLSILVSFYVFSESQRLWSELMRQTEVRADALAKVMETSAKHAILGNSVLEDLIGQRLLDNARLIDRLLLSGHPDKEFLRQLASMNRLQKVELMDYEGRPWSPPPATEHEKKMMEMKAWRFEAEGEESKPPYRRFKYYMWGRRWSLPTEKKEAPPDPPPRLKEKRFWEGSDFGVAVGARSFPGIIAVHANADYILNFKKEIGVQGQIEELGRQSDIDYVALLDRDSKIVAHTDPALVDRLDEDAFALRARIEGEPASRVVGVAGGKQRYEVIKPVRLHGSTLGLLKIGLSLEPIRAAWRKNVGSMAILALTILGVGALGMAVIFYNQQSNMREIKALEDEVTRKEHLATLGNLSATVAHEIRNPLNAISMGLQRLKSEFQPTAEHDQYVHFIELIRGEVHRLNTIVEQFLSLARPLELKREPVQVAELLKELSLFVQNDAQSSGIRISVEAAPELPAASLDRNYMKQVLLNLMLNGIQAMPGGGTLTLEAKAARGELLLAVADSGTGIPEENLAKIFEPYFTTKADGSGLGLAIARRIVEVHGGAIGARSEPRGGTRFEISLPLDGARTR